MDQWVPAGLGLLEARPACLAAEEPEEKGQSLGSRLRGVLQGSSTRGPSQCPQSPSPTTGTNSTEQHVLGTIPKVSLVALKQLQYVKALPLLSSLAKVRTAQIPRLKPKPLLNILKI